MAQLAVLSQQVADWHEARSELQRLEAERQNLLKEQSRWQAEAAKIEKLAAEQTAVTSNHRDAEKTLAQVEADLAALDTQNEQFVTARAELDNLTAEQPRLRDQMSKLRERIDRLQEQAGGDCPLCGQELSENHRHAVLADLEVEGKEAGDRFRANKQRAETLTALLPELEQKLKQKPRLSKEQQTQRDRLARAEARLAEITQALADWEQGGKLELAKIEAQVGETAVLDAQKQKVADLSAAAPQKEALEKTQQSQQRTIAHTEARLAEIDRLLADWETRGQAEWTAVTAQLAANDYAVEAQTAVASLNQQIAELGYAAASHESAKQARAALADAPQKQQALQQAQTAVQTLQTTLTDLAAQISAQEQTVH